VIEPSRRSRFAQNAAWNWLTFLFVAAIGFFLSPFIVHRLGDTAYGVWTLLAALVGYLGLLDFGIRGAVTRYIAHHHAAGDDGKCSAIVSAGMAMFALLGIVAIIAASLVALLSPIIFNIPETLLNDTQIVLAVGGFAIAATLIGGVFGGVVAGLERFDIINGITIAVDSVRAGAIVLALLEGYGLIALAFIQLAAAVLSGLAAWGAARKLLPDLRLTFRISLVPHMRTVLSFSMTLSVLHLLGVLIFHSDALIIAVFLPVSAVTYFAIAANLCGYARQVSAAVSTIMTPRVSALASVGSNAVGDEILSAARVATLVTASIAIIFWFRGESFIGIWMGPEFGATSGGVLHILAFVTLLEGARSVASASIIGVNRHPALVPLLASEAACKLTLSVALIDPLGLAGVALGTAIPSLIISLGYIPRCLSKTIGVPAWRFYRDAWLLPIAACVPFALASILLEHVSPAGTLLVFFAQVALVLPLVVVGAMVTCLTPAERSAITSTLAKVAAIARRGLERR
jgi:O-antigen/teichoic acid export membrane protein